MNDGISTAQQCITRNIPNTALCIIHTQPQDSIRLLMNRKVS